MNAIKIFLIMLIFLNTLALADLPSIPENNHANNNSTPQNQYMPNQNNSTNVILSPNYQDQQLTKKLFDKADYHNLHREKGVIPLDSDEKNSL